MKRWGILACLSAVCLLALVFPTQAAAANPILIVTGSSNPYTTFLPEILRTEGFNEFDTADISVVTSTTLSAYDLVLLGDTSLTAAQVTTLTNWVNGGGNLIAMHPDPQLAGLLGLADTGTALSNAYVLMSTSAGPGVGLVGQTIQFHGPAELYTLNGATSYATLYSSASTATSNPALVLKQVGSGQAAAFTYDLARSVAYTRQGNPAWSGQARDAGNAPPIRSYNLFFGAASFDPEPDWIDFNKIQIPQADEQQRLLANLILQMNATKKPLPRFWYLPKGLKAAVVMTGDDHGSFYGSSATANRFSDFLAASPSGCSVANWECVRGTAYLFPKIIATNSLTNTQVASYVSQGFEIGVHVDSATTCSDWTTSKLDTQYTNFLASLASQFPSLPAPQTHRMHCISWSDYDSQPTIELKHGIRFDTTYYYWPDTWINDRPGLYTGSGMPMRYTDRNGNLINVYQANTQMTDESGQSYPLHINTLLDNALSGSGYYGVFTANMHNDASDYPGPGADDIVASAQARGVPVVTSLQMLQWLDGRNGSSFGSLAWSGNVLSFSIAVGANANNLRAMLPANAGTLGLSSILLSGSPVSYQLQTTKGVQYAVFAASAGNYQATYGGSPMFSISGAISPAAVATGTTITATGPVTLTASPDSYGNYSLNGLPSGTYTVTPTQGSAGFSPASQSITISGANVAAVNFALAQTCPCSLWTNNTVPGTPNAGDASAIEVGVRFRADVAGNITGIRFYKSSSNTGTHIGNLWSNTGTKLGSATFSGETASGWQQVNFATPVAIAANTVYVASYHTTTGNYSDDSGYFASSYDFAPLHGVQDGTGGANGVYRYGASAFPNSTYQSDNYWVDVVFSPAGSYSLSGTISGAGGNGATVTLSGAGNATVTANASGSYTFSNLSPGSYTVTPSHAGFAFSPVNQAVTVSNANVTGVNFSATTYSISGTISGAGGSGATVNLTGTSTATTTADASGNYTFTGLGNGSYTVTPSKAGFTFTPSSLATAVNNANVTAVNFSTTTYSISGTISGLGGNGATVNLTGASTATVTADASGNYTFSGLNNGSYTVTPSKSGFTFTPSSQPATVTNANVTALNFSTGTFSISGTISGTGGNAATVNLTGTSSATVTADASGNYTFGGLNAGSYTVTPSKSGFTFTPPSQPATITNANITGVNFSSAAVPTFTISGTISGAGGSGATATLSGTASATVTADTSGNYTFTGVVAGSYTVTPSKSGFGFTPTSQNVTVTNANVTGVNFSTSVQTFTLQGTISGVGGNAATVTLSGTSGGAVTADASGNYTFTGLLNGAYTVTPSKTGFTFNPGSQPATVNGANVTGVNFSSFANCPCSLWTGSTVPGNVNSNDPNGVELGVRFTSEVAGSITGIRFYKGSTNTGTHIGNLWTNTGTLLATATFSNETASGWQQVSFASPVAIAANTTYVASYYTPVGNYSYDQNYFTSAFNNTPLHGAQDGSGGSNGVYLYSAASAFPTGTYLSTNYYVDVVLTTATTGAPTLSSVTLNPTSVTGGSTSAGTVTLSGAAPTGGATVSLSSNNAAATVPASVTVAAGATTATFTVTTTAVASVASATISGTYNSGTQTGTLTVNPPVVSSVTLNPTSVTGGTSSTGTVTLGSAAPTGGLSVALSSNNAAATVPASVTVAAGATTATFTVTTTAVTSTASATISASFNGGTQTAILTLTVSSSAVSSVTLNPTSVTGGTSSTGTVTLSSAAPTGGAVVSLSSNNAAATVPASVTVAAGATTATFTVTTTAVASTASATISGTYNSGTQTGTLTVNPPVVSSVTLNPTSVTGGTSSTGTVTLGSAAPTGGLSVTLSSNNAAATVPASVTVAAGATTATFAVTTTAVASTASATISATFNGGTQTATLTVNPPGVSSVTLNPTSVTGGTSSTGTVTLGSAAPTGGLSVGLSSNSTSATVPASVTVAAGATTATFSVTTTTVTSTTTATISATFNGGTQTAALTINTSSGTTYSISGTISNAGGNAATVKLTGTATATVTASATGTYTFSGLANGSYTVTPSKTGYIFTPASTAVTVNGANVTANFTSTALLAIDKTASTDRSTSATTIVSPAFTTTGTNELLLAFVSTDATGSGITVTGVTGGSLTWTLVKRTNTQLGTSEIWRAFSPAVLTNATVTATLSQSVAASITVVTFTGADATGTGGSGAIGATGTGNSAKGAPTASLTTTRNNSWVFGVGNDYDNATSRTVGANQTMVHQYLATIGDTYWAQRQTSTTPTSGTVVTINDTAPTGDRYNLTIVEVLPAQ